ncbi:MAG: dihydrolipoamide dehydrogenase [Thiotrichales bacterium SG8_50]|nr:MAG: dihydrolipoamide dehydrogenase [Thiotrichales bacterium SG8_50]
MKYDYDLVVIGAGPGGYVAAIRAAQLGLKTAVIEKDEPGGVCLNWGCIPSKNLIHQAEVFESLNELEAVGVGIDRSGFDYGKVQAKSRQVVKTLTGGVASLLKKNKVDYIKGEARLTGSREVSIDGQRKLTAGNILVATGSRPLEVPGFEFDEERILSSTGILAMRKLPESIVILGAGAIGCEFAYVMNSFGVKVTLVEAMDQVLPAEDQEVCQLLEKLFKRQGIEVLTQTRAVGLTTSTKTVTVSLEGSNGNTEERKADKILVVFGRRPNTDNIGLSDIGVEIDKKGFVVTNDYLETNIKGVYAIGDITRTPALAHVASKEGEIVVEHIAGHTPADKRVDPDEVPSAIYCEPQVAGFGLREQQAQEKGVTFKKSVFNYPGAGKTIAVGKADGFVKILTDARTGEILGAHVIGKDATELIHELLLAKHSELLPEDIAGMIHAHPTISEAVMEGMRGINGKPIHA